MASTNYFHYWQKKLNQRERQMSSSLFHISYKPGSFTGGYKNANIMIILQLDLRGNWVLERTFNGKIPSYNWLFILLIY